MSETGLPGSWSRLHPLSPVLKAGKAFLALSVFGGPQVVNEGNPLAGVLLVVGGTLLALLAARVSWRVNRFRVSADELHVVSGVLFKQDRRVPLARVQSIDVVRPLVGRFLGLAELRLEVVGGNDSNARLSYLTEEQAAALRLQLLARSGGGSDEAAQAAADDNVLVTVPTGTLIVSSVLNVPTLVTLTIPVVATGVAVVDVQAGLTVLLTMGPLLLAVGGLAVRRVLAEYGFTVAAAPAGLRLRHGLLDTRTQAIPAGRVQAVRVLEPLLWRRFGWVRVEVDVAGYSGSGEEASATSALLPVAPRGLALALAERVLGGPLPGPGAPVPLRVRRRAPLQRRRLSVALDDRLVATTRGVLTTTTDVVPLARVQSLRITDGPWQRRLGLASIHVDCAGRRLPGAVAWHRDAGEARALLVELHRRTAATRH